MQELTNKQCTHSVVLPDEQRRTSEGSALCSPLEHCSQASCTTASAIYNPAVHQDTHCSLTADQVARRMLSTDESAVHVVLCTMPPNWLTLSVLALLPEGAGLRPARHDSTLSNTTNKIFYAFQLMMS